MATFIHDMRIRRVQRTLRWLEEDAPLLAIRMKDLSPERQKLAKRFATNMIDHTRAELQRLMEERAQESVESEAPCEPAD